MAKRFFIIDTLGQVFRAYYAPFRTLTAPDGEPTKATFAFTSMLLQLVREHQPDYLALAMEGGDAEGFRLGIDPAYKANREPPPEDLAPQIDRILEIVQSQRIPVLSVPGFEADDIMATLAEQARDEDVEVILVSRDKDLDQLLTERVRLFDPNKNEFIGPAELQEKKGYSPEQAVEIQTLSGDTTDNVQGVKGVGPKKAADLIKRFGSAAAVVEHADELTPAMKKNVNAFAEHLDKTRRLVTLRRDVPIEFDLEACRWKGFAREPLDAIFERLGFRRLREQLAAATGTSNEAVDAVAAAAPGTTATGAKHTSPRNYLLVDTPEALDALLAELREQPVFAFDTETTHLNPAWAQLVGFSFAWEANRAFYLPVRGMGRCLDLDRTLDALRPIMTDPDVGKIGQNLKYDVGVLKHHGLDVRGIVFDTMIASFLIDPTRVSHSMDALSRELLGVTPIPISDLIGKGKNQITFDSVDTARACEYAAEDADITWQLADILRGQMTGSDLEPLFRDTELPLLDVLADMEAEGVRVDTDFLAAMSKRLAERLDTLTEQIHEAAGHPFNIDSTKQLGAVLFDELELPVIKQTAKKSRSTDAETLEALVRQTNHDVPRLVLEYRELAKLKGTYIDTLPQMICPRTGRIHASFHQTAAVTGRLSSSDPNLQNIPIRTELGREIRRAFIARDNDHVLITADYSQIELRVMAHFSRDSTLKAAFIDDQDIHRFVAAQVFGVALEEVTSEQRGRAKAVNFGIIYGQTAFGLARTTGMSNTEAQHFIDMYFMRYPGIRMFIDGVIDKARQKGYVQTILGRRRPIADLNSRNRNVRTQAERFAVNTVIQGSAADLIKRAMINIHRRIKDESRPSRMLIQVHDELVFDVPRSDVEAEAAFITQEMTTAMDLDVPIKVDLAWGDNWLEGK